MPRQFNKIFCIKKFGGTSEATGEVKNVKVTKQPSYGAKLSTSITFC